MTGDTATFYNYFVEMDLKKLDTVLNGALKYVPSRIPHGDKTIEYMYRKLKRVREAIDAYYQTTWEKNLFSKN